MAQPKAVLIDGPAAGRTIRARPPWPTITCYRSGTGPWHHYQHTGGGHYTHAGLCADHDHDGTAPWEIPHCDAGSAE